MRFYKKEIYRLISISLFNLFFFGSVLFAFFAERLNLNELFALSGSLTMIAISLIFIIAATIFILLEDRDNSLIRYLGCTPRSDNLMSISDIRYCERLLIDEDKVRFYFNEFQYALATYLKVSDRAYQNNTEERVEQDQTAGKICDKVVGFLRSPGSVAFFEKNQAKSLRKEVVSTATSLLTAQTEAIQELTRQAEYYHKHTIVLSDDNNKKKPKENLSCSEKNVVEMLCEYGDYHY
jgi:hypothetical protein